MKKPEHAANSLNEHLPSIFTWIAGLDPASVEAQTILRLFRGTPLQESASAPRHLTLTELAKEVGISRSYLHRLGVQAACGVQVAGRLRYELDGVWRWLRSDELAERARALSQDRKREREGRGR